MAAGYGEMERLECSFCTAPCRTRIWKHHVEAVKDNYGDQLAAAYCS
jgi:hypothetical protein